MPPFAALSGRTRTDHSAGCSPPRSAGTAAGWRPASVIAAPAIAQTQSTNPADQPSTPLPYDPGHDSNTPRSNAIAAESAPGVAAANRDVAAQARMDGHAVTAVNAANDARYQADVAAYRHELMLRGLKG